MPAPLSLPSPIPQAVEDLVDLILDAGAEPVVEHGVLTGEVAGLEVLRAVVDPYTGELRLEVGLGNHDREANTLVYGNVPPAFAIASVVDQSALASRGGRGSARVEPHRDLPVAASPAAR